MLYHCIRAENRKLRGSAIWLVFLIVPLISAIYGTFNYTQNLGALTPGWHSLFTQHTLFYSLFFFSPLVGVYAAYLWRLEHLGHNWNLIMTAPVSRFAIYSAKLIVVLRMALLTQAWVFALYVALGKLWAFLPGWPPLEIIIWLMRGAIGAVPVIALQLLLSMLIRGFAVPVMLALGGGVAGMLMTGSGVGLGLAWPYSLMMLGMNSGKAADVLAGGMGAYAAACAVHTLLFCLLAALVLQRRDVRA